MFYVKDGDSLRFAFVLWFYLLSSGQADAFCSMGWWYDTTYNFSKFSDTTQQEK